MRYPRSDTYSTEAELHLLSVILNGGRHNMRAFSDAEKQAWLHQNMPRTFAYLAAHRNWLGLTATDEDEA